MGTLTTFALLIFASAVCSGQAQFVTVTFQMNDVNGTAVLTWASNNVNISLSLSKSLGDGPVSVQIRPFWVDYDVKDRCSTAQLGAVIPAWTVNTNFTNNNASVTLTGVESLASLGGHSILLIGPSNNICASIEAQQVHYTAVAQFKDLIQGTVYFRQSISTFTRIVTDLFSNQNLNNRSWFITSTVGTCQLIMPLTQLMPFNPNNTDGKNCSKTAQTSCSVGQLTEKFGNVTIGGNKGGSKLGYTDTNLPSIMGLNGTLLVIETSNGSFACAPIKVIAARRAKVEFSHDGVTGSLTFNQISPFDPTTTQVNLKGLKNQAKGYHVHNWPTPTKIVSGQDLCGADVVSGHLNPFNKDVTSTSYPTPDNSTDDMYEVGDLSSKYGTLATKADLFGVYTDWNLPLFGSNSIIGRSLVIHHDDAAGSRWVCSNIEPDSYSVVVAIAVLKYPVIGQIMFMQGEMDSSETSVFAHLDYNDGRPGTKKHKWGVRTSMVTNDMLSTSRCLSTGSIYDPENLGQQFSDTQYETYCSKNSPLGCKTGDLSGQLGFLDIRNAANLNYNAANHFFADLSLPLSGPYSIIGKSVFIMNEMGTSILACANIQTVHAPYLIANLSMGGVSGTVSFKQKAGFGAKKTTVMNELSGLMTKYRLYVYDLPPVVGSSMCSNLGDVFNPLNAANASLTDTDDRYKIGDLARFEIKTTQSSFNLPLTGLTSINQRSLVVVDQGNNNSAVACAKITTAGSSPIVEAVSNFTGTVVGIIRLFQTVNTDGTMSDTSILVDLKNQDGHMSLNHNWHEHEEAVLDDANAAQGTCMSTRGHLDPYMAMNNTNNYPMECKPENPLRCEMGDQASKVGVYNLGEGRRLFTDVDLPLTGMYSGLGRSMVIHKEERVLARLDCADIIPITSDPVAVQIKSDTSLDKRAVARVYANAIMADPSDVVLELLSRADGISKLKVHFVGFKGVENKGKFVSIISGKDKSSLNPYAPYTGAACYSVVSATLLIAVLAVQLLNYL